jgi:hypothetical protein
MNPDKKEKKSSDSKIDDIEATVFLQLKSSVYKSQLRLMRALLSKHKNHPTSI